MTATIKERLLEDITQGTTDPVELSKRNGLNGHDLVKNLEQLRKEGHISLKWTRGGESKRIERVGLPRRRYSVNDRVYNWLAGRNVMGAWIDITPAQLNDELKVTGNAAGVAISNLVKSGRIEARKVSNKITALRIPLARPEVVVVDEATGSVAVTSGSTNGASSSCRHRLRSGRACRRRRCSTPTSAPGGSPDSRRPTTRT